MAAITRLSVDGYGARRNGSFAGKIESEVTPEVITIAQGGGGRWVIKKREKVRRLDEIIEQGVREAYEEITGTAPKKIQKEAAKLVRPYIEKGAKPESIPAAEKIDWDAMHRDARRVQAMLDLWQEQVQEQSMAKRLMAQNDEDVLLLLAM